MRVPGGKKPLKPPLKSDPFYLHESLTHCSLNSKNLIPCGFSNFRQLCKAHRLDNQNVLKSWY